MTDIVEFFEARLRDDELIAQTAIGNLPQFAVWAFAGGRDSYSNGEVYAPNVDSGSAGYPWSVTCDSEGLIPSVEDTVGAHIAHHDPARALREVAAKRSILAEHPDDEGQCARCLDSDGITYLGAYTAPWPCPTLRALAAVYSDHPDYRPDW